MTEKDLEEFEKRIDELIKEYQDGIIEIVLIIITIIAGILECKK